jgi:hypothetical protein
LEQPELSPPGPGRPQRGTITSGQLTKLALLCEQTGYAKEHLANDFPGLVSRTRLSKEQASGLIERLEEMAGEREQAQGLLR